MHVHDLNVSLARQNFRDMISCVRCVSMCVQLWSTISQSVCTGSFSIFSPSSWLNHLRMKIIENSRMYLRSHSLITAEAGTSWGSTWHRIYVIIHSSGFFPQALDNLLAGMTFSHLVSWRLWRHLKPVFCTCPLSTTSPKELIFWLLLNLLLTSDLWSLLLPPSTTSSFDFHAHLPLPFFFFFCHLGRQCSMGGGSAIQFQFVLIVLACRTEADCIISVSLASDSCQPLAITSNLWDIKFH